ncbi:hypothetical protein H1P_70024 [Hyella patelloides LEGE 07179]|uniref:Uncharacterized protein n=1 Tax=Hyella patelloides LEGE 07179 TaxID=945734 RepID=A0A563W375_9CYAN|nr:hypothetical protein H1P_70024 [Hyella patelloides LEGE 07179]
MTVKKQSYNSPLRRETLLQGCCAIPFILSLTGTPVLTKIGNLSFDKFISSERLRLKQTKLFLTS